MGVNVAVTTSAAETAKPYRVSTFFLFFLNSFPVVDYAEVLDVKSRVKTGANARYPATFPQVGYGPNTV